MGKEGTKVLYRWFPAGFFVTLKVSLEGEDNLKATKQTSSEAADLQRSQDEADSCPRRFRATGKFLGEA
jgi:hypothetical protein